MQTEILSIGDELLYGHVVDTNAAWLARQLLSLGLPASHFQTCGDELPDIVAAFRLALARADIVIATGGLGPTEDDLTAAALAEALGVGLEHREEVLDQMAARLRRTKADLNAGNRKQALVPRGAQHLRNDWGTAPGIHASAGGKHVFVMPGVPREMEGIFAAWVKPWLAAQPGRAGVALKHYHCYGLPESVLGDLIKDLMSAGRNPDVGTRVAGGVVTVRVVARATDQAAAAAMIAPLGERIRAAMGDAFFGEDEVTLSEATVAALQRRTLTLALAESCTAGLATATLARVPGVSANLLEAAVTYANEAKMRVCGVRKETLAAHGAVSAETAKELAEGIRARSGADIGVGITGIAGPDGATPTKPVGLVFFAVATPHGTLGAERVFAGLDRNTVRERAAHFALDLVRRTALAWPEKEED